MKNLKKILSKQDVVFKYKFLTKFSNEPKLEVSEGWDEKNGVVYKELQNTYKEFLFQGKFPPLNKKEKQFISNYPEEGGPICVRMNTLFKKLNHHQRSELMENIGYNTGDLKYYPKLFIETAEMLLSGDPLFNFEEKHFLSNYPTVDKNNKLIRSLFSKLNHENRAIIIKTGGLGGDIKMQKKIIEICNILLKYQGESI